jgi:hypothetical protein
MQAKWPCWPARRGVDHILQQGDTLSRWLRQAYCWNPICSGFLKCILYPSSNFLIMYFQASTVRCSIILHAAHAKPWGFCQVHTSSSKIDTSYRNDMETREICIPTLYFILPGEHGNLVVGACIFVPSQHSHGLGSPLRSRLISLHNIYRMESCTAYISGLVVICRF